MGVQYIGWTVVAVAVLIAAFALAPSLWVAIPLLWGVLALAGLLDPLSAAVGTMIAPPEMRASAFALGFLIRLVGAPFALLLSIVAGGPGTRWGLLVAVPLLLRGALHIFTAGKFVDADVERLDPRYVERERRTDESGRPIILEAKGITVSYDGVQVLFGVDMSIREGEVVALLGTNGAGKSTTLNAISGLVDIDRGNVWFDGEPITGLAPERIVAAGLVQMPGGRGTWPGLTVAENLRLGAYLLRRDKALLRARLDDVLDVFPKLRDMLDRKAGDLSGGERQMLTLAQAFLLEPKVLLIDELSLGLAPVVVQELLAAVRSLSAAGVTIVLVEQSVNVALALADRAYFMEKGRVRFEGATSELLERDDLLRSVFLGGPVGPAAAPAEQAPKRAPRRKGKQR